jgi:hypothetical protein
LELTKFLITIKRNKNMAVYIANDKRLIMTQEEKQRLVKALCGYLPYGVKVQYNNEIYDIDYISEYEEVKLDFADNYTVGILEIKPYLRHMSSMNDEEKREYQDIEETCRASFYPSYCHTMTDWLNAHHFDYRILIPMGLALEAPEGMYNF